MSNEYDYSPIRYSQYRLPNGVLVFLTQRPDRAEASSVEEFILKKCPNTRFCFTDDFVKPMPHYDSVPWHWFPWVPNKNIPIENVFAFINVMHHCVKFKRGSIWLHCDSSSMRAPTYFGLFLYALYPDKIEEICNNMTVNKGGLDLKYAKYSCAKKYAEISIKSDPGIKELISAWQEGGLKDAYEYYMQDIWSQ